MVAARPGHGNHGSVSKPTIPNAQIAQRLLKRDISGLA